MIMKQSRMAKPLFLGAYIASDNALRGLAMQDYPVTLSVSQGSERALINCLLISTLRI